jgi:tetratricopeptide (TPR) repeat protein
MTVDGLEQALGLFTKASALDPDYASAYGMAIHCHAHRFDLLQPEADDIAHRRSEVSRLSQIVARVGQDDGVALGEAAWAVAYLLHDLSSARQTIDRALELNPNLAGAWAISGWINIWQGHPDLAIEHIGRAERLDPGSLRLTSFAAMAHARFFLGEYEKALGVAERMLRHTPDAHVCLRIGAASAAFAGHIDTAHRLAARLQVVDPAFGVSRLGEYLGPYQSSAFVEKYAEGLRLAGVPE